MNMFMFQIWKKEREREREREEESDLNERNCVYVLNETEKEREVPSVNNLRGWSI